MNNYEVVMSEPAVKTIFRKNYQPSSFRIDSTELCFNLFDEYAFVTNRMNIQNIDIEQPLFLNGEELELVSIKIDKEILEEACYELTTQGLIIHQTAEQFELEIVTKIYPQKNTQLSGLYRSNALFCTQCEAEGFRRITYFLDRSDILSVYSTKIIADKSQYPVLLSNGNLVSKGELSDNRHWVIWEDPFKKPCYLFALVAGNLDFIEDAFITKSKRTVVLKIFVEKGQTDKCQHAMISLKKSMKWDEDVYGLEYDLDIFMIVAVNDFNMGAMENKGLNIFNTKYILADQHSATDQDFAGIEGVVAHEYFHNWTGNRVTCRDWFQLSLKEGLTVFRDQEFSRDMNSRSVNRIQDVKVLRAHQFPEDAGPMSHPVRPESYIEINNFYTSTIYNKGAEVIRMQHTLLGEKGYRKGIDLYFERHDGQAVTIDDFVSAMEDANDTDLTQFKRWYSQSGTPEVKARVSFEEDHLELTLTQYCRATPDQEEKLPFYIPIKVAIFSALGERYDIENELLILNEEKQSFLFDGIKPGAVISLLRDFSAPINLSINQSNDELSVLILHESDGFSRYEAMHKLQSRALHLLIKQLMNDEEMTFNHDISDLFLTLLDQENMDAGLKAELLQPLDFESMIMGLKNIDVEAVMTAKDFYLTNIARICETQLLARYHELQKLTSNEESDPSILVGQRKLKNVILGYLSQLEAQVALIVSQFDNALNMTDELAAFQAIASLNGGFLQTACEKFYEKWQSNELVLDKWFSVQAMANDNNVLDNIHQLLEHEAFNFNNPNKVRALILVFAMSNQRHFHTKAGYEFLEKMVIKLDKSNPQTAARLVMPLTHWRRYQESLQSLMKTSLENILKADDISNDLFEMVSKSLEV